MGPSGLVGSKVISIFLPVTDMIVSANSRMVTGSVGLPMFTFKGGYDACSSNLSKASTQSCM